MKDCKRIVKLTAQLKEVTKQCIDKKSLQKSVW